MDVAGDDLGEGPDMGSGDGPCREERRFGVGFLEPFADRQRLGEDGALDLERRDEALRIERKVGVGLLVGCGAGGPERGGWEGP